MSAADSEMFRGLHVIEAGMGSKLPRLRSGFRRRAQTPAGRLNFDSVRLTPHFAQDDISLKLARLEDAARNAVRECR